MQVLKDLPIGTIWPHLLEQIERGIIADIRSYADARRSDIDRGAETPELAALLVEKYGAGLARALLIVGIDSGVQATTDLLVRSIDPEFEAHRRARWAAKPAGLALAS